MVDGLHTTVAHTGSEQAHSLLHFLGVAHLSDDVGRRLVVGMSLDEVVDDLRHVLALFLCSLNDDVGLVELGVELGAVHVVAATVLGCHLYFLAWYAGNVKDGGIAFTLQGARL